MTQRKHAEIAGAGFAGLVAAIALKQRGWSVRVHEKSDELRAFGAGIFIWENGLRVLEAVGAYTQVLDGAFAAPAYESRTDGRCLSYNAINGKSSYRLLTMTRQHLYGSILASARRHDIEILTGSEAVGASPEGELHLADGRRLPADLVVAADGVRSKVRDSLSIPQQRRKYRDGIIRVLTDRTGFTGGEWDHVIDFWATAPEMLRILYTPCGPNLLYMAMMAPLENGEANAVPVHPEPWIRCFPQLAPILSRLGDAGRYDIYETTRLARWSQGRVAIVGDAAHAMPPTLAQGAGCAMMNALGLAVAMEEFPAVPEALLHWEDRERPMTDHTQSRAAEIAETRVLAAGMDWDDTGLLAARHIPTGTAGLTLSRACPAH